MYFYAKKTGTTKTVGKFEILTESFVCYVIF